MAQNSSGKRGNAPHVAVVIGVVLILIGAWNLVNVLVPGRRYFEFDQLHSSFVERRVALRLACCRRVFAVGD